MPRLRILYVGDQWNGSTSRSRFEALRDLGHEVHAVATDPPPAAFQKRLLARLAFAAGYPLDAARTAERVLTALRAAPWDLLWVDEVKTMDFGTLEESARLQPAIKRIAFIMDDPFSKHARGWRRFQRAIHGYDVHCVPRQITVSELQQAGARRVLRYHKGYDPRLHRPVPVPADIPRMSVFFAGHWEPKREAALAALVQAGLPLYLSGGPDWRKGRHWSVLKACFDSRGFYGERYAQAICAADIALCFYSEWNRDTENSRMYEIPACGTFMLAERNEENITMFREGIEAEFFGDPNELISECMKHLRDDARRRAIAAKGLQRASPLYSYVSRLNALLFQIAGVDCGPVKAVEA